MERFGIAVLKISSQTMQYRLSVRLVTSIECTEDQWHRNGKCTRLYEKE